MLHLQLGPSHVLMYFSNFVINVTDFIFAGSSLDILVPREIKLLPP